MFLMMTKYMATAHNQVSAPISELSFKNNIQSKLFIFYFPALFSPIFYSFDVLKFPPIQCEIRRKQPFLTSMKPTSPAFSKHERTEASVLIPPKAAHINTVGCTPHLFTFKEKHIRELVLHTDFRA
jgi:hypothetical protein